jgi:hypothetical protein
VEKPVELQVLRAAGGVAGDAQRDEGHLAADTGEADALGGRDDLDQPRRQPLVERRLGGGDDSQLDAVQHRALHGRVIVPQQRRAVGHVEVDVALAVDSVEVRPLAAVNVERPSQVGVEPHRGGDPTGKHRLRLRKKTIWLGQRALSHAATVRRDPRIQQGWRDAAASHTMPAPVDRGKASGGYRRCTISSLMPMGGSASVTAGRKCTIQQSLVLICPMID